METSHAAVASTPQALTKSKLQATSNGTPSLTASASQPTFPVGPPPGLPSQDLKALQPSSPQLVAGLLKPSHVLGSPPCPSDPLSGDEAATATAKAAAAATGGAGPLCVRLQTASASGPELQDEQGLRRASLSEQPLPEATTSGDPGVASGTEKMSQGAVQAAAQKQQWLEQQQQQRQEQQAEQQLAQQQQQEQVEEVDTMRDEATVGAHVPEHPTQLAAAAPVAGGAQPALHQDKRGACSNSNSMQQRAEADVANAMAGESWKRFGILKFPIGYLDDSQSQGTSRASRACKQHDRDQWQTRSEGGTTVVIKGAPSTAAVPEVIAVEVQARGGGGLSMSGVAGPSTEGPRQAQPDEELLLSAAEHGSQCQHFATQHSAPVIVKRAPAASNAPPSVAAQCAAAAAAHVAASGFATSISRPTAGGDALAPVPVEQVGC